MAKKDGQAEEVTNTGPSDEQMKAIQNRINDLVLELDAVKKGKGDASEIKSLRDELTEAQKELGAIKAQTKGAASGRGRDDNDGEAAGAGDGGYEHGFFS